MVFKKLFHVTTFCFHKIITSCSIVPHKGPQCSLVSLLGPDDFDRSMSLPKPLLWGLLWPPNSSCCLCPCISMVHALLCTHSDPLELWVRPCYYSVQYPVMAPVSLGVKVKFSWWSLHDPASTPKTHTPSLLTHCLLHCSPAGLLTVPTHDSTLLSPGLGPTCCLNTECENPHVCRNVLPF